MRNVDLAALKDKLVGVPGIGGLTQTNIGGRMTFSFNGLVVGVDPSKTDDEIATAIIAAADAKQAGVDIIPAAAPQIATPMPPTASTQAKPMTTPAPGSFAASLKAMMDEARAGLQQARADGKAQVQEAVGKLTEAKVATAKVSSNIAQTIHDEAASVMAELGQISNDL